MTITLSWQPNLDIEYEEEKGKVSGKRGREKGEGKGNMFYHDSFMNVHCFYIFLYRHTGRSVLLSV